VSEAFIAPATCLERHDAGTSNHTWQQQPARAKGGGTCCMRRKLPPVHMLDMHALSFSLSTYVTYSIWHIKGRAGVLSKGQVVTFYFLPFISPLERSSLFLLLPPAIHGSQKTTETWDRAPSLAHLYPILQISTNNTSTQTRRRVLLPGGPNQYKSLCTPICATV
jgi:hypothetical protein